MLLPAHLAESKSPRHRDVCTPTLTELFTIAKIGSIDKEMSHTHTHTVVFYPAVKDNEVMPFAEKQLELEIIVVNKVSKNQKEKCFLFTCRI